MLKTPQIEKWTGDFGREYTDRNEASLEGLDNLYRQNYGITRSALNDEFLKGLPRDAKILEVGSNIGNQLLMLQRSGFKDLHGIEIQDYALQRARLRLQNVELKQASAFEIPYPDGFFDLVFTSGVLIHIHPNDLPKAVGQIYRCASNYIWGLEYYSPQPAEVSYRGSAELLWKMDYANFYRSQFPDLELVKEKRIPYSQDTNVDSMFLLRRTKSPRA
jgi:pseudaminic acid biosynthesis-associated methylase